MGFYNRTRSDSQIRKNLIHPFLEERNYQVIMASTGGVPYLVRKSPSSPSQRFATKEFCTPSIPKIRPSHYRKSDRSVPKIDQLIVPSPHETKFTSISSLEVPTSKIFASVNLPNLNLLSKEAFQMTLQSFNTPPQPFLLLLRLNRLLLEQDRLMDRSVLALEPELLSRPEALHQTSNKVVLL